MGKTVDPQLQTMIDNMPKNTGKSLVEWFKTIKAVELEKHGAIMKLLKGEHGVTHGYANTISILYRQELEGGAPTENDLIAGQYAGSKAGLRPIYDAIISAVSKFGSDIEIAPKKTYVSLRRNKQFAIVQAATRSRVDLGFNLQAAESTNRLEGGNVFSGMCTHRVRLTTLSEVDIEVTSWLKQAYDQA
jgi:predicted transport protein